MLLAPLGRPAPRSRWPDLLRLLLWRHHPLARPRRRRRPASRSTRPLGRRFLPRHDIDQEIEHVTAGQCASDVGSLQRAALVLFGVDPGAHGELGDEDIAAFGEQDGGFGGDHLDVRVGFHDFLDAREGKLVELVVVRFGFEVVDRLLPVGG